MNERQRFWRTVALFFAIGSSYPIAVLLGDQPWQESLRWIQHDPGFTVFLALVLPFVAGVLAVRMDLRPLRRLSQVKQRLAVAVLVLVLGLGTMVAFLDLDGQVSSPIRYREAAPVLEQEWGLRAGVRAVARGRDAPSDTAAESRRAREEYQSRWPPIHSVAALGEVGSWAALVAFALNVVAGLFAAVLFWYLWLLVQFRSEWKGKSFDWLLLTVGA